jgi:hypothetical protein
MSGFSALKRRTVSWIVAGLGASVAAGLSLGLAVMAASQPAPLKIVGAGEEVDTGRWRVAATGAGFKPADPKAAGYLDRQNLLFVRLRFTNLSAASSNAYVSVASLDLPADGLEAPTYLLARDGAMVFDLHPDMPEDVVAAWKWPEGRAVPQTLRVTFAGQLHKRRDNLYGAPGWFPADPAAAVDLPVKTVAAQ